MFATACLSSQLPQIVRQETHCSPGVKSQPGQHHETVSHKQTQNIVQIQLLQDTITSHARYSYKWF